MADKNQNDRKGKEPRIIRLRLNLSWIYIIVLFGLGWWAMKGGGVAPQKVEWADVKEMVGAGDVKEIHFVRNDYKGTVTIRPEALAKYEARFPGGKVPSRSPHFTFLVSGHFDAENEFGALNEALSSPLCKGGCQLADRGVAFQKGQLAGEGVMSKKFL